MVSKSGYEMLLELKANPKKIYEYHNRDSELYLSLSHERLIGFPIRRNDPVVTEAGLRAIEEYEAKQSEMNININGIVEANKANKIAKRSNVIAIISIAVTILLAVPSLIFSIIAMAG